MVVVLRTVAAVAVLYWSWHFTRNVWHWHNTRPLPFGMLGTSEGRLVVNLSGIIGVGALLLRWRTAPLLLLAAHEALFGFALCEIAKSFELLLYIVPLEWRILWLGQLVALIYAWRHREAPSR